MSARKNVLPLYPIVIAQSMSSDITSLVTSIQYMDNIGIQLNWTGTPVGTFSIQISADYQRDINGNVTNPGNWINLVLSSNPTAAGSADVAYVDLNQLSAPWIRVVYSRTSGTGILDAFITGKML